MSDKMGLSEDEYLDIVERIQKAMCIEPFRPDVADVIALIGAWRVLDAENERLRAALAAHHHPGLRFCEACKRYVLKDA